VYEYVENAVDLALRGEVDAMVTGPLHKEALNRAGYDYPGHTEILAHLTDTQDYAMMLVTGSLRIVLVTIHVALSEVPGLVKRERVLKTIRLAEDAARSMGIEAPKVAVAGMNPHAGEGGLFGREEIEEIAPAVEAARSLGIDARGPFPADTVFYRAVNEQFDIVVAMYHDQGLIPIKLLGFRHGVNVTLGLPIIRTSVDHGTAFGRAGEWRADPGSLISAIKLACQMVGHRDRRSG
jgi:4-hydroxythreonine-4-phosphate dehydrogenase